MKTGLETKVGVAVFAGLVAFLGIYWYLGGIGIASRSFPVYAEFLDVGRLNRGAEVRMSGVKVGLVTGVSLTESHVARIDVLIWNQMKIPTDSVALVTTGAIIGDSFVQVIPGTDRTMLNAGSRMNSKENVTFDTMAADIDKLVKKFQKTGDSFNALLGDPELKGSLRGMAKSLNVAVEGAGQLIASTKALVDSSAPRVKTALANMDGITTDARRLTKSLNRLVEVDTEPNLKAILADARESAKNLNKSLVAAQDLIGSVKNSTGRMDNILGKVDTAAEQAQKMLTNLNVASESIRELTTDKDIKNSIKTTIKNIGDTSAEAGAVIGVLKRQFRIGAPRITANPNLVPEYGTSSNILVNTKTGQSRVDVNFTFALNDEAFYRVGLFDLGQLTKLNLQGGKALDPVNAVRYGLYNSKIGVGYDHKLGGMSSFSADLFDPNDLNLEMRGTLGINKSAAIYAGVVDVLNNTRRNVLVGVRYKR